MSQAANIKEVIDQLDKIIAWCVAHQSTAGYFACLYRSMTVAVLEGISKGTFTDGPRMERLDTIFANRYLQAWQCYNNRQPSTISWKTAFDACANTHLTVIQHLLLGINTHINLDLAIAAAETAPGNAIEDLQSDFEQINSVIASLTGSVYDRLSLIWFPLRLLGRITGNGHEAVVNFSIGKARQASWSNALLLAHCGENATRKKCIDLIDGGVARIGSGIIQPGRPASLILKTVRWMEPSRPSKVIELLQSNQNTLLPTP